jgi:spore coat polysaccharide biosynthesis protein SpsF
MSRTPRRVAIIQARMSSSRFPGKVLAPLCGVPMILFMVQRVRAARLVDHLAVATSIHATDDPLAEILTQQGIDCFRGSLEDVLDRYTLAARAYGAEHVVRLTGDCPLMDADLVDRGLEELARGDADYVSNCSPPSFPDGLDVECFTMAALETAWREARLSSEREHVTPFIRNGKAGLRSKSWSGVADLSSLRWTVDHTDDLAHVEDVVRTHFARSGQSVNPTNFDRFDLMRVLDRSNTVVQGQHERNEGYAKSLAKDSTTTN